MQFCLYKQKKINRRVPSPVAIPAPYLAPPRGFIMPFGHFETHVADQNSAPTPSTSRLTVYRVPDHDAFQTHPDADSLKAVLTVL